ncbi:MAG TPA: trypsin-like peptidase domain-containing protein [Pirellulales bacterium]
MNTRPSNYRRLLGLLLVLGLAVAATVRLAALSANDVATEANPPPETGSLALLGEKTVPAADLSPADGKSVADSTSPADGSAASGSQPTGAATFSQSANQTSITTTDTATASTPAVKSPVVVTKNLPTTVDDLATLQAAIQQAVKKALPATVGIRIRDTFGSGVIVTEDGYVLTAGHVATPPGRDATIIFADGKQAHAKTLGVNTAIDSGMLKITDEGKYPHVEMGHSSDVKLGQWCITLGHPNGYIKGRPPVLRAGRVLYSRDDAIGTDCTIVGGDSGGPLLNVNGEVIGIHSRISDGLTDNFHVPIDTFRDTWDRLAKGEAWGGYIPSGGPLLGINGQTVPQGCRVVDMWPKTPADAAGVKLGDIITKFSTESINSLDTLQTQLSKHKPGDEVVLTVIRGEETLELKVKLAKR